MGRIVICLLVFLLAGCVPRSFSEPVLKVKPKLEPAYISPALRMRIMRIVLEELNNDAFLKQGLFYMPEDK